MGASGFPVFVGTTTEIWTATEYSTNYSTPRVGAWFLTPDTVLKWIFLTNTGTTAITANLICTALTTDPSTFLVRATAGNSNVEPFAGARPSSATSLTQSTYGWFQIGGTATLTADAAGTAANTGVVVSNATVGNVEDMPNTGVGAQASFAVAQTTTATGTVVVNIFKSIWGV